MIKFMLNLPGAIIYCYLAISTIYLLVLALAGRWARNMLLEPVSSKKKILVLIPAFKEDVVIVETAKKAADHNYPSLFYKVLIVADSLRPDTIERLRQIPVDVLKVEFDSSTKAKSLHAGLSTNNTNDFEIAVILDADNVMEDGCLENINSAFYKGYQAIQCHRSAKNKDTPIARLDAISEEININLFRRGPAALGLSAMPLGSGMAFNFDLLKDIFDNPQILDNPAEDREIEIELMKRKLTMGFLNDVYVYDEKVSEAAVFQNQRTRWFEAQLNQIRRFFKADLRYTSKGPLYYNIFFQSLLLPRLLYLMVSGIVVFTLLLQWAFNVSVLYPAPAYWIGWMIVYFVVLCISVPVSYFSIKTVQAITFIPVLMISILRAIFRLKRNRKEFLHTSKKYNTK